MPQAVCSAPIPAITGEVDAKGGTYTISEMRVQDFAIPPEQMHLRPFGDWPSAEDSCVIMRLLDAEAEDGQASTRVGPSGVRACVREGREGLSGPVRRQFCLSSRPVHFYLCFVPFLRPNSGQSGGTCASVSQNVEAGLC